MRAFIYVYTNFVVFSFFTGVCFHAYFPQHIWSRAAALKSSKKREQQEAQDRDKPVCS